MTAPLIEARGLTKHFRVGGVFSHTLLHAVDDADFAIGAGEIVALVGESGSGKSTVARLLAKVHHPTGSAEARCLQYSAEHEGAWKEGS